MQIADPSIKRIVREGSAGIALIGSVAFCFVCPYAGLMGIAALGIWGDKLADKSESFVAKRLKRPSVA